MREMKSIGDNIVEFTGAAGCSRVETTKTLWRDVGDCPVCSAGEGTPACEACAGSGRETEPYVEHRVYFWRVATDAERDVHGWPPGHEIFGLEAAHETRDPAIAAAAILAGE